MPTALQLVPVPFQGGIDQGSHPDYVQAGSQTSIVNGRFVKKGALHKRFGYSPLGLNVVNAAAFSGTAKKLVSWNGNVCMIGDTNVDTSFYSYFYGNQLYAYSPNLSNTPWVPKGPVSECMAFWQPLSCDSETVGAWDVATANGLICYAFLAASGTNYTPFAMIVDATSGAVLSFQQVSFAAATNWLEIRVCAVPSQKQFVVVFSTASKIWGSILDYTTAGALGWTTDQAIVATNNTQQFDIAPIPGFAGHIYIAFEGTGDAAHRIFAGYVSVTASTLAYAAQVKFSETNANNASIAIDVVSGTQAIVAWAHAADGQVWIDFSEPVNAIIDGPPIQVITGPGGFGAARLAVRYLNTGTIANIGTTDYAIVADFPSNGIYYTLYPSASSTRIQLGHRLMSKPFVQGDKAYFQTVSTFSDQATMFLVDMKAENFQTPVSIGRQAATISPRSSNIVAALTSNTVSSVIQTGATSWLSLGLAATSADGKTGLTAITYDFSLKYQAQGAQLGNSLYLSGGTPSIYDGMSVNEVGFSNYPELVTLSDHGAGGNLSAGSYSYVVVAEAWNASGEVTQSASSAPVATFPALAAGHSVDVTIDCVYLTHRLGLGGGTTTQSIALVLYRTQANGQTYNRVTAVIVPAALYNNPITATITVNDNVLDAIAATGALWEMDGGVGSAVSNVQPPALFSLIAHNNRLFGIAGDQRTVWYTKSYTPNITANFADELTLVVEDGSMLTALGSLDTNFIVFTASKIYSLPGDGAGDDGQGSSFPNPPNRVQSDVGCIDHRSVVGAPPGLFFQSRIGIYLLGRDLSVTYVGKAVEDILATYPVIVSAHLVPYANEVRFVCRDVDDSSPTRHGIILVYNYLFQTWSQQQTSLQLSGGWGSPEPICGAAVGASASGTPAYTILAVDGNAAYENQATFVDNGHWVTLEVETAWLRVVDVSGYQKTLRAMLKADFVTDHGLVVSLGYNFDTAYTDTWTIADVAGLALPREDLQFHVGPAGIRGQAVRVKIQDTAPSGSLGTGEGAHLVNVAIQLRGRTDGRLPPNAISGRF